MSYEIRKPLTIEQILAHDGKLFSKACEISNIAHTMDDYEATIALAYIKRLIKSRTKENRD
jgi:hypothetical protein